MNGFAPLRAWRGLLRCCAAAALFAWVLLPPVAAREAWRQQWVAGATPERPVPVLRREAQVDLQGNPQGGVPGAVPMRVVVVVGSGCAGMGPIADGYFRGLERAQVWVLHKPHSRPWVRAANGACSEAFVRDDRHRLWQADALQALQALRAAEPAPERPTWLVGISEGADLLPVLGHSLGTALQGLVLLSASGLDPADTLRLQAQAQGRPQAWAEIEAAVHSARPADDELHGRRLGHWRDLLPWRLFEPLTREPWTVLHWWGEADELIPAAAHERFVRAAEGRPLRLCSRRWPEADHGLHSAREGALQPRLWAALLAGPEVACALR